MLGYHKRDPLAAMLHIGTGAGVILASLFTDYRAAVGIGRRRAHELEPGEELEIEVELDPDLEELEASQASAR